MVTLLLMLALVKDGFLALFLEILISIARTVLDSLLKEILQQHPRKSTSNLAIQLNCSLNTGLNRLRALGKVQNTGKWVPLKPSENNMN
jgi:hypothetical protein